MMNLGKLLRTHNAPLAAVIPYLPILAAGIGAGTAVYAQGKAEDAAESKMKIDAASRAESQELGEAKTLADRERAKAQAAQKEAGSAEAFEGQMGSMERSAEAEKRARDEERLLRAESPDVEYAAKFKAGLGLAGDDTASSFLVPKIAEDTGLVSTGESTGLNTPLTFDV